MTNKTKFKETEIGLIPEDWETDTLVTLCKVITDGSHFSPKEYISKNGKMIATVKNMGNYRVNIDSCKKISDEDYETLVKNGCKPEKGDVLFSKDGTIGLTFVYDDEIELVLLSSIAILKANDRINPYFLKYYLQDKKTQDLIKLGHTSGSALPRIVLKDLKLLEVTVPPINEQELIVKLLLAIDNKIELNQKMNQTLEKIGQAFFKHWFIDFEFPDEDDKPYKSSGGEMVDSELGEIPKGWNLSKIGNELKTVLGGTPSRKNELYWLNGTIPWINSGEVNNFRIIEPTELITEKGLKKSATKMLPKGTVVLAITGATLGQISRVEIDTCANQSVVGIIESNKIPSEFIYFWIDHIIHDLLSWQTGGAQQHINKNNIDESSILVPDSEIMSTYKKLMIPIFKQITINCFENVNISKIRDSLLPKLMSGKIRIKGSETHENRKNIDKRDQIPLKHRIHS